MPWILLMMLWVSFHVVIAFSGRGPGMVKEPLGVIAFSYLVHIRFNVR